MPAPGWVLKLVESLSANLWLFPVVGMLGAVALSLLLHEIDGRLAQDASAWYLFRGGPDGARAVLGAIATSIMTFTGVVFSVTVLVLQLASNQFSPRVLRTFLADRAMQTSLAVFIGTFVYSLLTLRTVRGSSNVVGEFVPSLSVWFAVVLATGSVAMFVFFIHHVSQSIRAVNVLRRIADETREAIAKLFPEGLGESASGPDQRPGGAPTLVVLHRGPPGVVMALAEELVWDVASSSEVTVALVPMLGEFVPEGSVLFEVWGDPARLDVEGLASSVAIGRERSVHQDPAFGFRGIVDIAERALSPGINDPSTAVQALDELHDLLRRLATRRFPDPIRVDEEGRPRIVVRRPDFDGYVQLALEEIRCYGAGSVQVVRRMRSLIDDLLPLAPPSRRGELRRQQRALDAAANAEGQPATSV